MKLLKAILLVAVCVLSSTSFAAQNSTIPLGGSTISPKQAFTLPLNKLLPNAYYQVVCKITDNNNQKNKVVMSLAALTQGALPSMISLNGSQVGGGSTQITLPQVTNTVEFTYLTQKDAISFTNLDLDDSVIVSDCVGSPQP